MVILYNTIFLYNIFIHEKIHMLALVNMFWTNNIYFLN